MTAARYVLTPRQLTVLTLIAAGATRDEIAARLDFSRATAKFHARGLFDRLGARNAPHAVALAYQRGLLLPLEDT